MKKLQEFVRENKIEFCKNLISETDLKQILTKNNFNIGSQLQYYILNFGYLSYKYVELYGINSIQKENSDMIKQSLYLHKYYESTKNLIALESMGEGDFILVDNNDKLFNFNSEDNTIVNLSMDLENYIIEHFSHI